MLIQFSVFAIIISIFFSLIFLPNKKSLNIRRLFIDAIIIITSVFIPLFIFLASTLDTPWAKDTATLGYLDMFMETKLYLLPFVIWAIAALYTLEIIRPKNKTKTWIVLGIFIGFMTSTSLNIYGHYLYFIKEGLLGSFIMLILGPIYVPIWYGIRLYQLSKLRKLPIFTYISTLISELPFWGYAIFEAKQKYNALPDVSEQCFVSTASSRGYDFIVGSTFTEYKYEQNIQVSKQMIRLWEFEALWRDTYPKSHTAFRKLYNVYGKRLSKKIKNRFVATICFLLIKPFEMFAIFLIGLNTIFKR